MRLENTTEHIIEINHEGKLVGAVPPATKGADNKTVNGVADVDDAAISALRSKDPVVKAWFESGDLVSRSAPRAAVTEDDGKKAHTK